MRTLVYSLIIMVLVATVGLGGLFDYLYQAYNFQETNANSISKSPLSATLMNDQSLVPPSSGYIDKTMMLEQLGEQIAATLNQLDSPKLWLTNWQASHGYQLTLSSSKNIPLPEALLSQIQKGQPLLLETDTDLVFHFYLPKHDSLLLLNAPIQVIKNKDQFVSYMLTIIFYGALLLLFLLWISPLIRRLIVLRQTAIKFGQGQLGQRINTTGFSYIKDIEIEFNNMAQRINSLLADVKLLSSAVSHDLRTPLAKIRFGMDTLVEEDDPTLREKYQQKISHNIDEMTALVETLLRYARLDQAMLEIEKSPVNLFQIIDNSISNKQAENVEFNWHPHNLHSNSPKNDSEFMVIGDKYYLTLLVNNLVQNAINYGGHNTNQSTTNQVVLSLSILNHPTNSVASRSLIFIVEDNGNGVPMAERENILKPFIRGENTLKQTNAGIVKHKGYGVGLAIVKRVLDWHQGSIEISDSETLSGAKFTIYIPMTK